MALALQPSPQTLSPRPPTAHRSPQRAKPTLMGLTHRQLAATAGRRPTSRAVSHRAHRRAEVTGRRRTATVTPRRAVRPAASVNYPGAMAGKAQGAMAAGAAPAGLPRSSPSLAARRWSSPLAAAAAVVAASSAVERAALVAVVQMAVATEPATRAPGALVAASLSTLVVAAPTPVRAATRVAAVAAGEA